MREDFLRHVTPVVLTKDEEANIGRSLDRLQWARRVVVLDSLSTDRTREIAASFANVEIFERPFDLHATQWNHALEQCGIETDWVLALDADYILTDALLDEIRTLTPPPDVVACEARFRYCIEGRPLRGSLYPPVRVLFRRELGRFEQDGHTHRLRIEGTVFPLRSRILHDDRKPLSRWLESQHAYMAQEAAKLRSTRWRDLGWADRIRMTRILGPPAAFLVALFVKGAILDGRAGLHYALQRLVAEAILSMQLIEGDLRAR